MATKGGRSRQCSRRWGQCFGTGSGVGPDDTQSVMGDQKEVAEKKWLRMIRIDCPARSGRESGIGRIQNMSWSSLMKTARLGKRTRTKPWTVPENGRPGTGAGRIQARSDAGFRLNRAMNHLAGDPRIKATELPDVAAASLKAADKARVTD